MISTTDMEQFQKAKAASAQEEAGTPAAGSLSFGCSDPMAGARDLGIISRKTQFHLEASRRISKCAGRINFEMVTINVQIHFFLH